MPRPINEDIISNVLRYLQRNPNRMIKNKEIQSVLGLVSGQVSQAIIHLMDRHPELEWERYRYVRWNGKAVPEEISHIEANTVYLLRELAAIREAVQQVGSAITLAVNEGITLK